MATKTSECKKKRENVTIKQLRAIELRLQGKTIACICQEIGVNEITYYRWCKIKKFREAQEERRIEVFAQIRDRTVGYLQKALTQLGKELDKKEFSPSAVSLMLNFYGRVGVFHEHLIVQQELKRLKDELGNSESDAKTF